MRIFWQYGVWAAVLTLKDNVVSAEEISLKRQCGHIHLCPETSPENETDMFRFHKANVSGSRSSGCSMESMQCCLIVEGKIS